MKILLNILAVILLLSCNGSDQENDEKKQEKMEKQEISYLVFRFHDSSVPPPYHRSYSLDFREDRIKIVVDSYGDIITDTILVLGTETINKALALVDEYKINPKDKNEEKGGCIGGTGISVSYGFGEKNYCDGYVYFCGGEKFGDLSGDLENLKYSLIDLIPNFSQYRKED